MMSSAYKLDKQGDNIQAWCTSFPVWNLSVVSRLVLTVASWPAYRSNSSYNQKVDCLGFSMETKWWEKLINHGGKDNYDIYSSALFFFGFQHHPIDVKPVFPRRKCFNSLQIYFNALLWLFVNIYMQLTFSSPLVPPQFKGKIDPWDDLIQSFNYFSRWSQLTSFCFVSWNSYPTELPPTPWKLKLSCRISRPAFLGQTHLLTCDFPSGDVFSLCSVVLGSRGGCRSEFPPSAVVEEEGKRSENRRATFFRSNASKSLCAWSHFFLIWGILRKLDYFRFTPEDWTISEIDLGPFHVGLRGDSYTLCFAVVKVYCSSHTDLLLGWLWIGV